MRRLLAGVVVAVVWVIVRGIEALDAVVFDATDDEWTRYQEEGR